MCRLRMCHNRYIEYTLMYIGYECIGYVEYNEYSFMYFITPINFIVTTKKTMTFDMKIFHVTYKNGLIVVIVSSITGIFHLLGFYPIKLSHLK